MKFFLLINVKLPTVVGNLTYYMSRKNSGLGLFMPKKAEVLIFLYLQAFKISCSDELSREEII